MTDAIEAGARAIDAILDEKTWTNGVPPTYKEVSKACIEAAIASGALVPASAELSGISGELRDRIAEAIRGDGSDLGDTPWEALSDERKVGWRGDADRALAVVKDYLTTEIASAVAEMRERCAKECDEHAREWDWNHVQTLKSYADYCAASIRQLDLSPACGEHVVVPREPTMAMLAAGEMAWINDPLKRSSTLYRAMLAAATRTGGTTT